MTNHKKWAVPTGGIFIVLAVWSLWKHRGAKTVHPVLWDYVIGFIIPRYHRL